MSNFDTIPEKGRRNFLLGSAGAAVGAALLARFGITAVEAAEAVGRSSKALKAAFSNAGLQVTWCAQGKKAAEYWGKLFNVDISWFDGELSTTRQRTAVENMASQDWDFVAIQALTEGTLADPVNKMIAKGIPVISIDTFIAPYDKVNVHTRLTPDNNFMGTSVTQALVDALNGEGNIVMTTGPLGFSAVQGRSKAFEAVVKRFPKMQVLAVEPGDWDVTKVGKLWESWLNKYPKIDAAFFHNDDMALAAYNVMKAHNRTNILIGGVDAMPPAVEAVLDGRMYATVRGSSARMHGGAVVAGVAAVVGGEKTGPQGIPQTIVIDGPLVTKENAPGLLWEEAHYLI
jgi:ribose transport system substrate-binding protein